MNYTYKEVAAFTVTSLTVRTVPPERQTDNNRRRRRPDAYGRAWRANKA